MQFQGAIDCDIHPGVPNIKALLPYMDDFWRESFIARGIDGFDMMSYPLNAPLTCRQDWRVKGERAGSSLSSMQRDALDAFGISLAIDFDCYLVDEVTGAGDERFRARCEEALLHRRDNATLVMISHDPGTLRQYCTRGAVV